jgi:hypothetical protein
MQEKCAIFEKNQLSIVNYQLYFVPLHPLFASCDGELSKKFNLI